MSEFPKLYSREELVNRLYWGQKNDNVPRSRLELCRLIGRKKSPHIWKLIEQLVDEGYFEKGVGQAINGQMVYTYLATDKPCSTSDNSQ